MSEFQTSLRTWRRARRFSQLQLAMEADVSSRHISFLESGRAKPSREMVARLGEALQIPLEARNQMLLLAGFAPRYARRDWDADEMRPVRAAMTHMLTGHAPYPAMALDRYWNVVRMNGPAGALFGALGLAEGDSLIDLMCSPELPGHVENWAEVAHHSARRLRLESAAQGGVARLEQAAAHLAQAPVARDAASGPVVPAVFRIGDRRVAVFATIAQFGTPEDLMLDDLKIELYFPADVETGDLLAGLAGG